MGFKELLKAKTFNEYAEAKKDPNKMEEIKRRTFSEVVENASKPAFSRGFGFTLTDNYIIKGSEKKSLNNVIGRIESGSELQSRVTMTRLVALGVFAFAAKKKTGGEKYLTVEGPDFVWTEEIKRNKKDINKAMNLVSQINANAKKFSNLNENSKESEIISISSADELKKFKELLDSGVITQEEFEFQKSKLLK